MGPCLWVGGHSRGSTTAGRPACEGGRLQGLRRRLLFSLFCACSELCESEESRGSLCPEPLQ